MGSCAVGGDDCRLEPTSFQVCQELAKVLLHLSDALALPELPGLRHKALVALAVARPVPLAQYLTTEFYSPHYSLRQRTDILEVN